MLSMRSSFSRVFEDLIVDTNMKDASTDDVGPVLVLDRGWARAETLVLSIHGKEVPSQNLPRLVQEEIYK